MIEKRNAIDDGAVKDAAGDAGVLDDIVDMAADKMGRAGEGADPGRRGQKPVRRAAGGSDGVELRGTEVC